MSRACSDSQPEHNPQSETLGTISSQRRPSNPISSEHPVHQKRLRTSASSIQRKYISLGLLLLVVLLLVLLLILLVLLVLLLILLLLLLLLLLLVLLLLLLLLGTSYQLLNYQPLLNPNFVETEIQSQYSCIWETKQSEVSGFERHCFRHL